MFEEGPTPMTAHESGTEQIILGGEMGGNKGKDINRDTVDRRERIPPFTDGRQRGGSVPVELRNGIQGEAAGEVSPSFLIYLE